MKAVVLSGGSGTRLRPVTYSVPKQLIPVGLTPVLGNVLADIGACGIEEAAIIVSPESHDPVVRYLERTEFGLQTHVIVQPEPNGLAAAFGLALPWIGDEESLLYLGDCLVTGGASKLVASHVATKADATLMVAEVDDPSRYGIVEVNGKGAVTALVEKPKAPRSNLAIVGIYAFGPAIADAVSSISPSARGEYEITDAIQHLVSHGGTVRPVDLEGWWVDTGTVRDVLAANARLLESVSDRRLGTISNSAILGDVVIEPGARVMNSKINGPAVIGEGAVVDASELFPAAHVSRDVVLREARVGDSIIMEGSSLTRVGVRRSIVGPNSEITGRGLHDEIEILVGSDSRVDLSDSQSG